MRFLLCDRDGKYFLTFEAEDVEIFKSALRASRMNGHCERVICGLRREVLDRVLVLNEFRAQRVLAAYQRHYNGYRLHQARDQLPPDAHDHPAPCMTSTPAGSWAPESSAAWSTSTATQPDVRR
ncbi:integrase core domain-containing protein [Saccharopolyspora shandongensis]|uniref:integrase core domain-containing protein n=1 Tax=Saccharopolyspora shandongensis TaxID=418495 RepID=UPI001C4343A5|nr:integrase core domain-containing protein [Saccharopolyspora shandongensis]